MAAIALTGALVAGACGTERDAADTTNAASSDSASDTTPNSESSSDSDDGDSGSDTTTSDDASSEGATSEENNEAPASAASGLEGEFALVDGTTIDLGDFANQDVVLWFWAPW